MKWFLDNFFFPGVVIHEFSHYIVILFMYSASVEDVKLSRYEDSYVQYEVYNPKIYKTIIIALAPFYVNTAISIVSIYTLLSINLFSNWTSPIIFVLLYYVSIVSASKSIPSVTDIEVVFQGIKKQIFTNRFILIIILSPFYIALTGPVYIISSIRMRSSNLYYSIGVIYAFIVLIITITSALEIFNPSELF
jgi:hypothetical protein